MAAALTAAFLIAAVIFGFSFVVDRAWKSWSEKMAKDRTEKHVPGGRAFSRWSGKR